ncbi:MAG: hypothetical protein RR824_00280 [Clostridia bacterium]
MKNRFAGGAIACVGAVIGAGFASGREIYTFFTRYGIHSWWLILLAAGFMAFLCALCLREASSTCMLRWCALYQQKPKTVAVAARACATVLTAMIGGAMISASGHMVALLWNCEWAYPIGAVGTLFLAWIMGFGSVKPLTLVSGVLTSLMLLLLLLLIAREPVPTVVSMQVSPSFGTLAWAAARAIGYASMNLTLSISVVCKCAKRTQRSACRMAVLFGMLLVVLLFVSNYLYLKHPELDDAAFPIVKLLSAFGQAGFVLSVALLYLAVLATLIAILNTLRSAVEVPVHKPVLSTCITLGLPLLISVIGFTEIVQSLYAPAGLCCLLVVFVPLMNRKKGKKQRCS